MDIVYLQNEVKNTLQTELYKHSLRIVETDKKLADIHSVPEKPVEIASILHDFAKDFPVQILKEELKKYNISDLLAYHHGLWHGPIASKIAEERYNISNKEVLNAIYYHTTGRNQRTVVEHVVFLADYTEPSRTIPGIDQVRQLAYTDLQKATRQALKNTIIYLIKKDGVVHPDSFKAYNYLTNMVS